MALLRLISGKSHQSTPELMVADAGSDFGAEQSAALAEQEEADGDDGKGELVRGFTTAHRGLNEDERDLKLAEMVATALANQGWADVNPREVLVADCSGAGGSQTYKVTAPAGTTPPAVALHSRSEGVTDDELSEPITEAAAITLGKAGLAPPRLAFGADWFIEPWTGSGEYEFDAPGLPQLLGEKLAELHAVPTEWFDEWRTKLREQHPFLKGTPEGSHIWWFAKQSHFCKHFLQKKSEEYLKVCCGPLFTPRSPAAQRIVTTHGDFHRENVIRTEDGPMLIDLEFTGSTWALHDLGYAINCCSLLVANRPHGHSFWKNEAARNRHRNLP